MSRIGKQILAIPQGVEIKVSDRLVSVKGPKGLLEHHIPESVHVQVDQAELRVTVDKPEDVQQNMLWGTNASILQNLIQGVTEGFMKELEINGVGYRASVGGAVLTMSLGFSHPVVFQIPKGIDIAVEKNVLTIKGIDKHLVGQVAAQIRALRPPEPYKGKGIKYTDEIIRRKAGKAAAGTE